MGRVPGVKRYVIGAVIGALLVGAIWAWVDGGAPAVAPLPPIIRKVMVPIGTVREIPDAEPSAVETLRGRTRPAEVDPAAVRRLALALCQSMQALPLPVIDAPAPSNSPIFPDRSAPPALFARVGFDATKHVGLDSDTGRVVAGWTGSARCETAPEISGPWSLLHEELFDQTASVALSELAPSEMIPRRRPRLFEVAAGVTSTPGARLDLRWYGEGRRWGIYMAGDWIPDPDSLTAYLSPEYYEGQSVTTYEADRYVVAGGVALRFGGK